ncbi:hypothetical protein SAY87_025890 [Trapa incisa]|uniref:Uncharacterized protein n=1 Tax=Trapa incisa TaxID=236973 RepID=A0AAN7GU27_9MYRT|nr:hypothetical protein SAY87_025890 [Trapa incisa]
MCGEWAHFGCDRRQGLGAFKDYAKTDGLEYICPQCSMSNFRKKSQKTAAERLLNLTAVYGFWKHVSNLDHLESSRLRLFTL